ncbi:MAG: 1-deoxy-D-xylulose-5-phosphate synthase [Chloroflexi bacterium]|nr:1-deoxy-D-xylulose-5-phosphate synthase [Chloroflexota bacterium]MCL5075629.1 1-deoxy-D-xylulose-5-phosphate synthase [Chloroflexota bacterium]
MARLLDSINEPADLKRLTTGEIERLAREIREELVGTVFQTGGHLASNLGVVELTLALHSVFNSPKDKIVWDVGHQCYVHKMLTGRKDKFHTIRQFSGLSGFPTPNESPHDAFGTGHASTSVSAALGMAVARDRLGEDGYVIAVIGDGALTGGLAFEGLNNAGHSASRLIVVLNDNQMSISPNVGALAKYLGRLRTDPRYYQAKSGLEHTLMRWRFGKKSLDALKAVKNKFKGLLIPTMMWEELGFTYIGPVDGHNIGLLQETLQRAKTLQRPAFVHVCTVKGRGYDPAEKDSVRFHGVPPNGGPKSNVPSYTKIFGETVARIARGDPRVVAITAAMAEGTGLVRFALEFPQRFFDVGIAEGHAVTFAAGLASRGMRPIVAIYSTFLQRAYDQIIHDVCMQDTPVVFAIDRAGIVGDDGRTHQGTFDLSYLRAIPNLAIMTPRDENELQHMLWTALNYAGPVAIRYPRGDGIGVPLDDAMKLLPWGRAEILRQGDHLAILAVGSTVYPALAAADILGRHGLSCAVVNMRFVKPLDTDLIIHMARRFHRLVTIEENALAGGFGSGVLEILEMRGLLSQTIVKRIGIPDEFVDHGPQDVLREKIGLTPQGISQTVRNAFPDLQRLTPIAIVSHRT